ncbi:amidohydrolase family protein [Kibdelosporangium philippinense]|uniref:Amidohydrolase family protein n=1 Tax=Kibdelosporangium philippinense TaxID=211113 RepID=A0ABS8ZU03_9PSEU|nr:amidohydrolase family protein [Kibdelosporangium philippinense]MCE7011181.1 amidohydrolase family protein [Kibdelosporangium philippinense]
MRVDAHHHLWDLNVRDQDWIDPSWVIRRDYDLSDLADAAVGFDRTVLVQTITVPEETPEFLAIAGESDLVGAVVGWVDLTSPAVADTLAELRTGVNGEWLRGIRHQVQGEADPRWLCRDDVQRGLQAVFDAGLLYELLVLPHQLEASIETVAAFQDHPFVLDHCAKPPIASGSLEPWASSIRELAGFENVTCKLSGLVTEADWAKWTVDDLRPYAEVVLEAFGPSRVMFGSDWPVCLLAASYEDVVEAAEDLTSNFSQEERDQVFGGTAARVYTL